jgi:hypothetical protein
MEFLYYLHRATFNKSQITQQQNALYFHFLSFNPYICFNIYKAIFRWLVMYIYFTSIVVCYCVKIQNIIADNNGCTLRDTNIIADNNGCTLRDTKHNSRQQWMYVT